MTIRGRILKSIGGLYYVETEKGILACRARGIFRLKKISPYVGDYVEVEFEGDTLDDKVQLQPASELLQKEYTCSRFASGGSPVVFSVEPRKNEFVRPPLSNIDCALMVISLTAPVPNSYIIDKLIAVLELKDIEPLLAFTKIDLKSADEFISVYKDAWFKTFSLNNITGQGTQELHDILKGKTCALIGNSGVGKSSLLNALIPHALAPTAQTSKKLGRGKHTTRHVELYHYNGGYLADTPGFSTVDAARYGNFTTVDLIHGFREFVDYAENCPFKGCTHTKEKECAVKNALKDKKIAQSRYNSYITIFEEIKKSESEYK